MIEHKNNMLFFIESGNWVSTKVHKKSGKLLLFKAFRTYLKKLTYCLTFF